jgi:hypothetical protein
VRRLRDFQPVVLVTGSADARCRVVAVGGDETVLQPERSDAVPRASLPLRAQLIFDTGQHPVLLSGMADAGPVPGTLRFWVTDSVGQHDSRLRPRLKAAFDVTLSPVGEDGQITGPPVRRKTIDVSAGGLLVAQHPATRGGLELAIVEVPGLPRPVQAGARVVRVVTTGDTALRFEDLDAGVAETLDTLIFTVRQQVARRAFAAEQRRAAAA